jgi:uncharacterized glyoxalase superfamily protein PhnB
MDVYPCFTYRDVKAALDWLVGAFDLEPRVFDEGAAGEIQHAAVAHRQGMVLIESERPKELHGSHTGKGWVYLAVDDLDAHYQRASAAGVELLNEPHDGPGGMHGYSARDLEGNVWTFGTARPTP